MTGFVNLEGDTREIAGWIWRNLVPQTGQSSTIQGELLRAVEKLRWEAQNNGNGNWDDRFEMLLAFLGSTLLVEVRLSPAMIETTREDLASLADFDHPYIEDDVYDRLTCAVVAYCRLNPALISRRIDPDQYR